MESCKLIVNFLSHNTDYWM